MLENNKHIVNPEELDHLLNQAFLELDFNNPKNDTIMETISNQVMNTDLYSTPQTTASKGWLKNIIANYKIGLSILALVIASVAIYFFIQKRNTAITQLKNEVKVPVKTENENVRSVSIPSNEIGRVIIHQGKIPDPNTKYIAPAVLSEDTASQRIQAEVLMQKEPQYESTVQLRSEDSAFVFPILSEKEIKETVKQKKKMTEQLAKLKREKYPLVPMGSFKYKGETVSLQAFYMQSAEVTNLEYRTFLYDLLIQNRKEDFLIAKPDQSQWVKANANKEFFRPMEENYFTHPAYNDYPAVNMSRKGAEMYCVWLTQLANASLKEKGKALMNDLRIPTDFEWTYAAEAGLAGEYPWGNSNTKVKRGCYLMNFNIKNEKIDSMKFLECNKSPYTDAVTSAGLMLGKGTITANVYSYNPNNFYLYCMSGNVAEMVRIAKLQSPDQYSNGTKGGGWNSDAEHVKLNAEDEYKGKTEGLPFVGFRPIFTSPKK